MFQTLLSFNDSKLLGNKIFYRRCFPGSYICRPKSYTIFSVLAKVLSLPIVNLDIEIEKQQHFLKTINHLQ